MDYSLINTLKSYIPDILQSHIVDDPTPPNRPFEEDYLAAVLFVDISGFTALTEQFAAQGPSGAEDISAVLNDFYGQWIEIIRSYGGDIIKFAGDGLLVIWRSNDLEDATLHAAQTALEARKKLEDFRAGDRALSTRIAIGAGKIALTGLGGVFNRWEMIITGDAVEQVGNAQTSAKPGEIIASREAWQNLRANALGDIVEGGHVLISAISSPVTRKPERIFKLEESSIPALRSYIPGAIAKRIDAGQSDWLAELRRVTSLFINIPEMKRGTNMALAQKIAQVLQEAVYRYEGSVNKISVDEKGVSLLAAFGLPPFSHEDDPLRGVLAAQDIRDAISELSLECFIGIASGRVFCGVIGNTERREYTITGDAVNLSSRLMYAADKGLTAEDGTSITILCDNATFEAAKNRVDFSTLEPISVRGKSQPVPVFVPQSRHAKGIGPVALTDMIGREDERFAPAESLRALVTKESRVVFIEGEAGLGKSRLVEELFRQAEAMNVHVLLGLAEAIEQNTPYHAWKNIAANLFQLDERSSASEQRMDFEEVIGEDTNLKELAPLLSAVLPFAIPDNDVTKNILGDARASAMHELIVEQLARAAGRAPIALVIEDVHWLDSGSWALLSLLSQRITPMLIVLTMRSMGNAVPMEYVQMRDKASTRVLALSPLNNLNIETLLCQRLNVRALPEQLVTFIRDKAEGHPFYSEELTYALRDGGFIEVRDGQCQITSFAGNLDELNLPGSLEGVITSRIDKMPPSHQLTLKVASVIGRVFALRELSAIYPIKSELTALPDYLSNLERQELTILDTPDPDISYLFKHIITQEVAYNLLLFSQRRSLHRAMAEWYEEVFVNNIVTYYPALAHHWKQADVPQKAIEYLEKSGAMAFRNGAFREAIRFHTQALEKTEALKDATVQPVKKAAWLRSIGEAQMGLGEMEAARGSFRRAVQLLKRPAPTTSITTITGLVRQLIVQAFHRWFPDFFFGRLKEKDDELQEAALIFTHLAYVDYINLESLPMLYHVLRGLNLSEIGGSVSPARVWALGSTSAIYGFIPNHALAEHYAEKALQASSQVDDIRAQLWTHLAVGAYKLGVAQWDVSRTSLLKVKELAASAYDKRLEGNAAIVLAGLEYYRGGNFRICQKYYENFLTLTKQSGDHLQLTWATYGISFLHLVRGEFEQALANVTNGESLDATPINIAHLNCIRALANWRLGKDSEAIQNCANALKILRTLPPQVYSLLMAYRVIAQVTFEASERGKTFNVRGWRTKAEMNQTLRALIQLFRKYHRTFPIGEPSLLFYRGSLKWLEDKHEAALNEWQASAKSAQMLAMPWDEAYAMREIGRRSTEGNSRPNLLEAISLFEASGATYDALEAGKLQIQ